MVSQGKATRIPRGHATRVMGACAATLRVSEGEGTRPLDTTRDLLTRQSLPEQSPKPFHWLKKLGAQLAPMQWPLKFGYCKRNHQRGLDHLMIVGWCSKGIQHKTAHTFVGVFFFISWFLHVSQNRKYHVCLAKSEVVQRFHILLNGVAPFGEGLNFNSRCAKTNRSPPLPPPPLPPPPFPPGRQAALFCYSSFGSRGYLNMFFPWPVNGAVFFFFFG